MQKAGSVFLWRKVRRLGERSTRNNRNYPSPRGSSNINTDSTRTRTLLRRLRERSIVPGIIVDND